MSYLADVKSEIEDIFLEAFEKTWKEAVEPALKQSYKNGVKAGAEGTEKPSSGSGDGKPKRRWSKRRRTSAPSEED